MAHPVSRSNVSSFSATALPDNAIDRLSTLPPSTTGSLSSITTTSLASSEPGDENSRHKPSADAAGRGGAHDADGSPGGDDLDDEMLAKKLAHKNAMLLKQEKWWQTTIQVSIPFFLAGIGTIGAGIILGRVEVSNPTFSAHFI